MSDIYLTDLIDVDVLQKVQDSFARLTGLASLTTDINGNPVTKGSNFTDYCMKYTRNTEIGCGRCMECDRFGAETALKTGKSIAYVCHSGLVDFAAPIMVNGEMIGCFIGGQALTQKPDPDAIKLIADEIGVPFEEYWEAISKVQIIDKDKIDAAAESLFMIAQSLSDIAFGKYQSLKSKEELELAAKEIERAANMKTDFLANMSHEIRTPMNAVIGLAEMALREDLPQLARDYVTQIKNSGRSLLGIINDILDYSKIDSGKMDIIDEEYETLSLFNDVANIIMTRAETKGLEVLVKIDPQFPYRLLGDSQRIRQIMINLANNAVKFTNKGHVTIEADYSLISDDQAMINIAIRDTGIGIKPEDLNKIFESFQQVDSKRNRNVEGTGLGLAISKKLVELMGGALSVDSEYEKGSTFSFTIPQKIIDAKPIVEVKDADKKVAIGFFRTKPLARQFFEDMNRMGVYNIACYNMHAFKKVMNIYLSSLSHKKLYFFVEESCYNDELAEYIEANNDIDFVIIDKFGSNKKFDFENARSIRKPLSTISVGLALNNEAFHSDNMESTSFEFDFTAPSAKVLIVDDNLINLTVAEGLIEPLKMKVFTATSGKKAIELIENDKFDLIFMDHMMPDMDGVETTRVIRRLYKNYDEVPIIALTANAVGGMKEMFLSEGMNDFVPKPIEIKTITAKIKQWLPVDKVESFNKAVEIVEEEVVLPDVIGDLDVAGAISLLGNKNLYKKILKSYYKAIPSKTAAVREFLANEDWPNYTIEVHALKSLSKQIGASELSAMAAELEKAGNSRDTTFIKKYTEPMLDMYLSYEEVIKNAVSDEEKKIVSEKPAAEIAVISELLTSMLYAIDDLDMDMMEQVYNDLNQYSYSESQAALLDKMQSAVDAVDVDALDEIINLWKKELGV